MDAIDFELLSALVADARTTYSDLSARVGLSGPSTADRVRKLEDRGAIAGYHASLDGPTLGLDLGAFISVSLTGPEHREHFLGAVESIPQVLECHHVAGDDDYLLKVRVAGTKGLEELVSEGLKAVPGISRTRTTVVLSTRFERPLGPEAVP